MNKLFLLILLPGVALAECLPCPAPHCMEALEVPIDQGYCAPSWVLVKDPFAPECKEFANNFATLCPQCVANVLPPWCNRPHPRGYVEQPVKPCPEVSTLCPERPKCESLEPLKAQVRLLQKQAKKYREQIARLKNGK